MRSRVMHATIGALSAVAMTVALAAPASAQGIEPIPTVADQPAATLLLPYFEVDLANPAGANTYFTINNASGTAVLAHVTIWSAMHVPVYTFDVYLTGYDAQQVDMRDVLSGVLPQTASFGQDPGDAISPQGPSSQDINFASCSGGSLPPAALPQATIDHIRNSLTGAPSAQASGMCATIPDGTRVARGYVTVDTVNSCSLLTPGDPGYFGPGGTGVATNQNVLWGDAISTNHLGGLDASDGSPLVHIRADAADPKTSVPGNYTFYGRLVNWSAADNREPLSTTFLVRYVLGAAFSKTDVTVWRDAKIKQNFFPCAGKPTWYPLGLTQLVFFDEQEHPAGLFTNTSFSPVPPVNTATFPLGTQRVAVGGPELPTPFNFGWMYLNLATAVAGANGPADFGSAQAWVEVRQKGSGKFSVGYPATMYDSAKERTLSFLPIF